MTPHEFVARWRGNTKTERQSYQQFFLDLCRLVEHPTPNEFDPSGKTFCFEAGVTKVSGGQGFADVWFKNHFAIEFKGPDGNLDKAYTQLLEYREALENPPLLIVSDTQVLRIHTNFTNCPKTLHVLALGEIETPAGLQMVRNLFYNVEALRPDKTAAQVTEEAAAEFARLADHLRRQGHGAQEVAHYLIRLLFILFAEDIDLLPRDLFTRLVEAGRRDPPRFTRQMRQLFYAMQEGDVFGESAIRWFNGGLFDSDSVLAMDAEGLAILHQVTGMDWAAIEPSILGTLFTRSLDPAKRAQLGAHYTSKDDILLIVEPVLMAPLRREWATVQARARTLVAQREGAQTRAARARFDKDATAVVMGFVDQVRSTRVLDPACGSGNFLYVSLRLLLDLEQEVSFFCGQIGLQPFFPLVDPRQLYGIEKDPYAHELAQATVWIGYLQWHHDHAGGSPSEPVLRAMDNIREMDAILAYDAAGQPVEPEWPEADVIVGNPPFLGGPNMRGELGDEYIAHVKSLYQDKVSGVLDLVCYWYIRAADQIANGRAQRVGLLATNSIRFGDNRKVLERIKRSGDIFMAWSDRPWIQDGAAVRVSMIGFDGGNEQTRVLDGAEVPTILADLSSTIDVLSAYPLVENSQLAFSGTKKYGPFEITPHQYADMSKDTHNSEVLRPWVNGSDIAGRPRDMWIIDFTDLSLEVAKQYVMPYRYVEEHVKPFREHVRNPRLREEWWLYEASRPNLRRAVEGLERFIVTPAVSKHRVFSWLKPPTQPDQQLIVFPRSDDYFFGVLQSSVHEVWVMKRGNRLGVGNDIRYNATETFATFPFPWPPGREPADDARVAAIAAAARDLVAARDAWLNPRGLGAAELKQRTLTNLYNARPEWLAAAHARLDAAVLDAYGWPHDLGDEEILGRLLALNQARAAGAAPNAANAATG